MMPDSAISCRAGLYFALGTSTLPRCRPPQAGPPAQPSAYVVNRRFGVFGEQRNRGLELSVFGVPLRGVRVLGGLTLLDTEQVATFNGVNQGKDAIGVPKTQLTWAANGMCRMSMA